MEPTAQMREVHGARSWRVVEPRSRRAAPGELWDRHGSSAYALACALLGDEAAAAEAVRLAMADLVRSTHVLTDDQARRLLTRSVYRHAPEHAGKPADDGSLPRPMVWLSRLARLQRASLALCVYGGLTHREAATLLGVPPATVAELITAGLRELGRLAAADSASCA
jgi:DNA-directed RNA polymerase specialized sigma24 family protein